MRSLTILECTPMWSLLVHFEVVSPKIIVVNINRGWSGKIAGWARLPGASYPV